MSEQKPGGLNSLKSGTYTVTKVFCTQLECLDRTECHDTEGVCAEIGLLDEDPGCYMICHDYHSILFPPGVKSDRRVYWGRLRV